MLSHIVQFRVRYGETDAMGVVYYGNYALYHEIARTELLRKIGISYKELESKGILMPVIEYKTRFFIPAHFDDLLTVSCTINQFPTSKIIFEYQIFSEEDKLINTAETTLVFKHRHGKLTRCPMIIKEALHPFFNKI